MQRLFNKAHAAGMRAGQTVKVTPMVVLERENPMDDTSPVKQEWHVDGGPCGFAWVRIKGNTRFGRWCVKHDRARKGYPSGLNIHVWDFGQSMARKYAYAQAFAAVLTEAGVTAYAESRMD